MVPPFRLFGFALVGLLAAGAARAEEVNVYSARQTHLIKPVFDLFTRETGIKVNVLTARAPQLLERLKSEGRAGPADILLTTDVAYLHNARVAGVLQPVSSAVLEKNIPAHFRDPRGYWFGLSARARVIFYAKGRVSPTELSTYEALADPKWKGRICVRSSSSSYNQTLLAGLIATLGRDRAEKWAAGVVANMARKPQGGDRDQIRAVAAGACDLAIANTYYFGGLLTSKKAADREAATKVALFWPNQNGRGAHMNVAGAGVTVSSKNKVNAVKLLEFMSGPEAQRLFAQANHEFPVLPTAERSPVVVAWGEFRAEKINVATLGENKAEAVKIFDRVGWR